MTNSQTAYCALVNDQGDGVLREIIDFLGLLESGGLGAKQKKIGTETIPCHMLHLDTKYYTCDVPLLSCHSFEHLKSLCAAERSGVLGVFAVLFCATRQQLTNDFLALLSKYSSSLEKADVKAIVLREDETDTTATSMNLNDELVNRFALSRHIEIIKIGQKKTICSNVDEEEGLIGIPRLMEAIETIRWPNMRMKPNPLTQLEHRVRLEKYIRSELCADVNDTSFSDLFGANLIPGVCSKKLGHQISIEKEVDNEPAGSDYPDSEDEEAILEWFDRPQISEDTSYFSNIPPPQNKVTNLQQSRDKDDLNVAIVCSNNMQNMSLDNAHLPLLERVDIGDGIPFDFLKAISSSYEKRGDNTK